MNDWTQSDSNRHEISELSKKIDFLFKHFDLEMPKENPMTLKEQIEKFKINDEFLKYLAWNYLRISPRENDT